MKGVKRCERPHIGLAIVMALLGGRLVELPGRQVRRLDGGATYLPGRRLRLARPPVAARDITGDGSLRYDQRQRQRKRARHAAPPPRYRRHQRAPA